MADSQSIPPVASDASADHLKSLYKMSVTAGLGSTDYVAINGASITAAILGCFSWLGFFADVLLVIPLVAVVFGVAALRQIGQSNGTQGGRIWAVLGIVLALGFGGTVVGQQVKQRVGHRADEKKLLALVNEFQVAIQSGDTDKAYSLFSADFQRRFSKEAFEQRIATVRHNNIVGNLESIKWNGVPFQYDGEPGQRIRYAAGTMLIRWQTSPEPARVQFDFRADEDDWRILKIVNFLD